MKFWQCPKCLQSKEYPGQDEFGLVSFWRVCDCGYHYLILTMPGGVEKWVNVRHPQVNELEARDKTTPEVNLGLLMKDTENALMTLKDDALWANPHNAGMLRRSLHGVVHDLFRVLESGTKQLSDQLFQKNQDLEVYGRVIRFLTEHAATLIEVSRRDRVLINQIRDDRNRIALSLAASLHENRDMREKEAKRQLRAKKSRKAKRASA